MEVTAGVVGRNATAGTLLTLDRSVQLLHILFSSPLRCKPGDTRLHYSPHLQTSHYGVEPEFRYAETSLRVKVHKALTRQTPQRLPYGRTRDAEFLGEFDLA